MAEEDVEETDPQPPPELKAELTCLNDGDELSSASSETDFSITVKPSEAHSLSGPNASKVVKSMEWKCSNGEVPFVIDGGAERSQLIIVGAVLDPQMADRLSAGDVLLSANKLLLSGKALLEVATFLQSLFSSNDYFSIEFVESADLPAYIPEVFADQRWINLHVVIRDNALLYTAPYTTREPIEGEIDGRDYHFVSMEEFQAMVANEFFLETAEFNGDLYGTPRPPDVPLALPEEDEEDSMNESLGTLPPNWEIAFTELGEKYFINHTAGTTQWIDPRIEQIPSNGHSNGHLAVVSDDLLPHGWERVDDEVHGTFYVDHINKRTQYEPPEFTPLSNGKSPTPLRNGFLSTGITTDTRLPPEPAFAPPLVAHNDEPSPSIFHEPNGWNLHSTAFPETAVRRQRQQGFTRDPATLKGQLLTTRLYKGPTGLGFTLVGNDGSNAYPEFIQIKNVIANGPAALDNVLHTGDVLVYVDDRCMLGATQDEACRILRSLQPGDPVTIQVCRGYPLVLEPTNKIYGENIYAATSNFNSRNQEKLEIVIAKGAKGFGFTITETPIGQRVKNVIFPDQCPNLLEGDLILEVDGQSALQLTHTQLVQKLKDFPVGYQTKLIVARHSQRQRSRTPTAGFRFGEKQRTTPLPIAPRSKTPAPRSSATFRSNGTIPRTKPDLYEELQPRYSRPGTSNGVDPFAQTPNYIPISALSIHSPSDPKYRFVTVNLIRNIDGFGFRLIGGLEMETPLQVGSIIKGGAAHADGRLREGDEIMEIDGKNVIEGRHDLAVNLIQNAARMGHVKMVVRRLKDEFTYGYGSYGGEYADTNTIRQGAPTYDVHLTRGENEDFGCTLLTINHRFIGRIIPNSPAERSGNLRPGDCVVAINGFTTGHLTHHQVINYIKTAGNQITFTIDPTIRMPITSNGTNGYSNGHTNGHSNGHLNGTTSEYGTMNGYGSHSPKTNGNIVSGTGLQYLNEGEKDHKLLTVELSKGAKGFGFSIRGGFEFGRMPLFILRMADDGPAAKDGTLRIGDELVEINGETTTGMTHERAIALIREQTSVRLVVRRPNSVS